MMLSTSVFGLWRVQVNRLKMRHELEMSDFEASKLREMDKVKSRFFANISHEFRTPLTLILGPIENLLSRTKNKESRTELRMMKRSVGSAGLLRKARMRAHLANTAVIRPSRAASPPKQPRSMVSPTTPTSDRVGFSVHRASLPQTPSWGRLSPF